jgi:hypothetical protein
MGITLSPTLKRVTPGPTADTTPAPSDSGTTWGRGGIGYCPRSTYTSRRFREAACILICTSFAPGWRSGASPSASL